MENHPDRLAQADHGGEEKDAVPCKHLIRLKIRVNIVYSHRQVLTIYFLARVLACHNRFVYTSLNNMDP